MIALNIGSGQRRFDPAAGWVNIDCVSREGEVPDLIADARSLPYADASVDISVLHHVLEHFPVEDGKRLIAEAHRVLKPGGSLLIFVPDLKALAQRWLAGELSTELYLPNIYGAYHGEEGDRHCWGYTMFTLIPFVDQAAEWEQVKFFDWRIISGADIARDWWIMGVEGIR